MSISGRSKLVKNAIGDVFWVDDLPNGYLSINLQCNSYVPSGRVTAGSHFTPKECREISAALLSFTAEMEPVYTSFCEWMDGKKDDGSSIV